MSTGVGVGEWLPVKDAAERLGLTIDRARRRLRNGQLQGRQVAVAQGHVWEVWLPDDTPAPTAAEGLGLDAAAQGQDHAPEPAVNGALNGAAHQTADGVHAASDGVHQTPDARRQTADGTPEGPGTELVATQRAREMAEYSAALLEPWRRQAAEQAERIGRLEERAEHLLADRDAARAELEQTRARLAEATAPPPVPEPEPESQDAPPAGGLTGRRWWRWLWGLS